MYHNNSFYFESSGDEYIMGLLHSNTLLRKLLMQLQDYDRTTFIHGINVSCLTYLVAKFRELPEEQVSDFTTGALLHDIGKLYVPKKILTKTGVLTRTEWEVMKKHPVSGYELCVKNGICHNIARCVLEHHERIDGSGYPKGLKAEQLSEGSKIIMVADVYDAMSSKRPYKDNYPVKYVQRIIEGQKNVVFDKSTVDALFKVI